MRQSPLPRVPALISLGIRPIPPAISGFVLGQLIRSIARRHPDLYDRLSTHVGKRILLEPTDLPLPIVLALKPPIPTISIGRSRRADAQIVGPLAALLGLLHGRYDGDALFFSGDLVIKGDTEVVLAFRNAIDNAEIDLLSESAAMFGPFSGIAETLMRHAVPHIEHHTGLALTRNRSVAS